MKSRCSSGRRLVGYFDILSLKETDVGRAYQKTLSRPGVHRGPSKHPVAPQSFEGAGGFASAGCEKGAQRAHSLVSALNWGDANFTCKITYIASRRTSSSDRHEQIAAEITGQLLYVIGVP
jgi:hypothetical protein